MSQSVVTIRLNGTPYQIGCGVDEEDHVTRLGAEVEDILQSLVGAVGQIGEARLLAMATLILADKASESGAQKASDSTVTNGQTDTIQGENEAADALELAADRIAELAVSINANNSTPS
mgnify:CR=1 FL=1